MVRYPGGVYDKVLQTDEQCNLGEGTPPGYSETHDRSGITGHAWLQP